MTTKDQWSDYEKLDINKHRSIHENMGIYKTSLQYLKDNFIGKKVVYVYGDNELVLNIQKADFPHMCGIMYKQGKKDFIKHVESNKLNLNLIYVKKDGTTELKLQVLNSLKYLLTSGVHICREDKSIKLEYDLAVRTNKKILALALVRTRENNYSPISLINLNTRDMGNKLAKVDSIYTVDYITKEKVIIV